MSWVMPEECSLWNYNEMQLSVSLPQVFFSCYLLYSPENLGEVKATQHPKQKILSLKPTLAKPGMWGCRAVGRFVVVRSPWPLPSACTLGTQDTEEIIKETRKKGNLPAHQLSLVGHGLLAHPAGQEKRAQGLLGASQTLGTTWLFVLPLSGLKSVNQGKSVRNNILQNQL